MVQKNLIYLIWLLLMTLVICEHVPLGITYYGGFAWNSPVFSSVAMLKLLVEADMAVTLRLFVQSIFLMTF